jgi:hypothetical protein
LKQCEGGAEEAYSQSSVTGAGMEAHAVCCGHFLDDHGSEW